MESDRIKKWKALISEARIVYGEMGEEEAFEADNWLDEEFRKEDLHSTNNTIMDVIASNPIREGDITLKEGEEHK